jgi:AAA domain
MDEIPPNFKQLLEEAKKAQPTDDELCGKNLIDYNFAKMDESLVLLGNRYLERKTGIFFVAPSGVGKSTAAIQMAALWSCALPAFDIQPKKDLGIVIFQSEDSENDLIEMSHLVSYLDLSPVQVALVKKNTWIETVKGKLGPNAIARFRQVLKRRQLAGQKIDLIVINPYTAYLGGDIISPEANIEFLRGYLDALLIEFNCAALIVHHTPKMQNQKTDHWDFRDWMYSGAGSSAITNWARAFIAIEPIRKSDLFRFIAAKRGERIEWEDRELFCKHDSGGALLWHRVEKPAVTEAKARSRRSMSIAHLLDLVPVLDPIPRSTLTELARNKGFNRDSIRAAIEQAIVQEKIVSCTIANNSANNHGRPISALGRHPKS